LYLSKRILIALLVYAATGGLLTHWLQWIQRKQ